MTPIRFRDRFSPEFCVLAAFLSAVLMLGGGSRADISTLLILRPLAVAVCVYAALRLSVDTIRPNMPLLASALTVLLYVLVQLVPLPPEAWRSLPGRELVVEIERLAGIAPRWRPFTLTPMAGWNAFFSLFIPLGVLLLGIRIGREERFALLYVMLAFGGLTALIGLLQVMSPANGPLYFYRVTNNGLSVGLFANRNHQAVYLACLIPMLAVLASQPTKVPSRTRLRIWLSALSLVVLVPMLLATASRAGLIVGVMALASVPFLFSVPADLHGKAKRKSRLSNPLTRNALILGAAVVALIALVVVAVVINRSPALQRLMESRSDEARSAIWSTTYRLIEEYFPWGSGVGSFVEVFKVAEPVELIGTAYINHAHNDYLELLLVGGVPAALLLLAATVWFIRASIRVWTQSSGTRDVRFGRLATVVIAILAVGSAVDYPLRTPSLAAFFVIAVLWLRAGSIGIASQRGFPNHAVSASAASL